MADGSERANADRRTSGESHGLRFVPHTLPLPESLAWRRIATGGTIVLIAAMMQAVPMAVRASTIVDVLPRFAWFLLEMFILVVALSSFYDWSRRRHWTAGRTLACVLLISAVVSTLLVLTLNRLLVPIFPILRGEGPRTLPITIGLGLFLAVARCGVWALAFVVPYVAEDSRLRALEADKLRLEAEKLRLEAAQLKSTAELAFLRSKLEPHFLLNTLNAIAGFVTENPRDARRLLACLGDLLRDSPGDGKELRPLSDEIAWLRRYAEILEARHAGVLAFEWDIAPAARGVLLPRLLLQPLVENAVKHGALRRRGKGVVAVRASVDERGTLVCVVDDNGPGLPDGAPRPGALGLRLVQRRLELESPAAVFRMESSEAGTRATVTLPTQSN